MKCLAEVAPRRGRRARRRAAPWLLLAVLAAACAPPPAREPGAGPPLRAAAAPLGIRIGAAVSHELLEAEPRYRQVFAREFDGLTPENEMKWERVHPEPERWEFGPADALVDFAQAHGMHVKGHTLVWHEQLPAWVEAIHERRRLREVIAAHVTLLVQRYRGRVQRWDVVNEAIADDGSGMRDTHFRRVLGERYVAGAFRAAHAADPGALLFYNDYSIDDLNAKSDAAFELLSRLVGDAVPIHGVGLQMHVSAGEAPSPQSVARNVERLLGLGLLVDVTEMDVRIRSLGGASERALQRQAEVYAGLLAARLRLPGLTSITFWGFTDAHSWIDRVYGDDDPLLFDARYEPKPAYFAVRAALERAAQHRRSQRGER